MEELSGKVAVVTGAASGIGRALAHRFAAEGMKLVLGDIEQGALDAAVAELPDGTEHVTVVGDVSVPERVDDLRRAALDAFGTAHVVCNNAGVGAGGPIEATSEADWEWVLGVNLWGVIHGVRTFLPVLQAQGEGHIVNTASAAGLFATPYMGPYNVSKYGVVALSETLFHELRLARSGLGVSVLCPSWVRTNIATASRNRPGGPAEAADDVTAVIDSFISSGIEPELVADKVVDAIRTRTFWILTHDDTAAAFEKRAASILDGTDPPMLLH